MPFFIIIFIIVFFIVFILVFRNIRNAKLLRTVTKPYRGTHSERDLVLKLLKYGVPSQMIFHDLYVKKLNGEFSQIDLVVPTNVGIFVFEVKDYSGWIFGKGYQSHWTQVLAYGKIKYRFYNPIMQNSNHIKYLKSQLNQFENIPFYSIVVFYGDCVLKNISFVPNGTFLVKSENVLQEMEYIVKNNNMAPYTNRREILKILKIAVENGEDIENQIQHSKNIQDMLWKNNDKLYN